MRAINKDQSVISFGSKRFSDLRSRSRPSRYIFRRRREIYFANSVPKGKANYEDQDDEWHHLRNNTPCWDLYLKSSAITLIPHIAGELHVIEKLCKLKFLRAGGGVSPRSRYEYTYVFMIIHCLDTCCCNPKSFLHDKGMKESISCRGKTFWHQGPLRLKNKEVREKRRPISRSIFWWVRILSTSLV